ncbi:MAG: hypothetical protein ABJ246_06725 [Paracoccaceae bacterium]
MPRFTRPDGSSVEISATSVARARPTITNEIYEMPGHTGSALFNPKQLILEAIDIVGPALKAELASFAKLHAPNNANIWFEANSVKNAEPPRSFETSENTRAVVVMGGVRQRVSETVTEAQAVIDAARASS